MSTPILIATLLIVWAAVFLVFLLPAIWLGRWVAKLSPSYRGVVACLGYTKIFVALAAAFLLFARFESLPHVSGQRSGFVIFLAAVVFGVPVFIAFLVGMRRARTQSGNNASSP
jgi:hypothetical protein